MAVLTGIGVASGEWLGQQPGWVDVRYKTSELLQRLLSRQPYAERTVVVYIDDDEYWKGPLARRVPIRRDYLAKLLRALDIADPAVIGVDFDLRSPTPNGSVIEHPAYIAETREFLDAVRTVSTNRPVVLPRTVELDTQGNYVLASDIYIVHNFEGPKVFSGYIALPYDLRQIPTSLLLKSGERLDSFAQAVVRAYDDRALAKVHQSNSLPYGSYMKPADFRQLSASEVLRSDAQVLRDKLGHQIVVVGGT